MHGFRLEGVLAYFPHLKRQNRIVGGDVLRQILEDHSNFMQGFRVEGVSAFFPHLKCQKRIVGGDVRDIR
jgi:hypothetical protein